MQVLLPLAAQVATRLLVSAEAERTKHIVNVWYKVHPPYHANARTCSTTSWRPINTKLVTHCQDLQLNRTYSTPFLWVRSQQNTAAIQAELQH